MIMKLADISMFESLMSSQNSVSGNSLFNESESTSPRTLEDWLDTAECFNTAYNHVHKRPYDDILSSYEYRAAIIEHACAEGWIDPESAHEDLIDLWTRCRDEVEEAMMKGLKFQQEFMQRVPGWGAIHGMAAREDKTNEFISQLSPQEKFALMHCYGITHGNDWIPFMAFNEEGFDSWYTRLCRETGFLRSCEDTRDMRNRPKDGEDFTLTVKDLLDDPFGTRELDRLLYQRSLGDSSADDVPTIIYDDTDGES